MNAALAAALLSVLAPMTTQQPLPADPLQAHAYRVVVLQQPPDATAGKIRLYTGVLLSGQTISGRCRRTNYCPLCSGNRCADGSPVRPGVCAASRNIPMHSVLWTETDGLLLLADRGGAVRVGGGYTNRSENARVDAWQWRCGRTCNDGTVKNVPWALLVRGDGDSRRNSQRRPLGEIERGFCR